jgi:dihydroorotase
MKITNEPLVLLRGARLIDPVAVTDEVGDLLVRGGRLERSEGPPPAGAKVLDLAGHVISPGFTDIHVHLREPGGEESETIASGCAAALSGGVTTMYAMANTNPVNDDPAVTSLIIERARAAGGLVRVFPVSAVSRGFLGEELVDFEAQVAAGAGAFSDDGVPVVSEDLMGRAMERAAALGSLVLSHAEDKTLAAGGAIREGEVSRSLGVPGIPAEAETRAVERDIATAERTGAPIHICHVSTAGSVRALRAARARGVPVTAETAPHYLVLTVEDLRGGDPHFKMNPPLGTEEDRLEVRRGLAEGVFDAIATDHAPHAAAKKSGGLAKAAFGIIGMETLLPMVMTGAVEEGLISLPRALALLTTGPASVMGWEPAGLGAGAAADLNVLDLETLWTIDVEAFASRSRNCPFDGREVRGRVRYTMVGDSLVDHEA